MYNVEKTVLNELFECREENLCTLTEYDKKRAFDTYSQSTFHEIIQKTIQLYNQFHLYSLLNNSVSPSSDSPQPIPLLSIDNETPDYPPLFSSEPNLSSSSSSTQSNLSSLKRPENLQSKESLDEESIPSKKPKEEVSKYNYMGVKHKQPMRRTYLIAYLNNAIEKKII